jgi:superfamily II DNA helicase RecQ
MRFRVFQYPLPTDPDVPDLNAFLASSRVASVSHHVVPQANGALLLFVVEAVGAPKGEKSASAGGSKVDYREVLSGDEFAVFSKLRSERRRVADAEGVPVYTVFSNAQLAEMVQRRAASAAAIGDIDGVGRARVEKYAQHFVPILSAAFGTAPVVGDGAS